MRDLTEHLQQQEIVKALAADGEGLLIPFGVKRPWWTLVDEDAYASLKDGKFRPWITARTVYVEHRVDKGTFRLHREILCAEKGTTVDHKNGIGLDNRRENLRFASLANNQWNRRKAKIDATSQYKGVWLTRQGYWVAKIRAGGEQVRLGGFTTEQAAAWAYDEAARELHGEYARVNGVECPGEGKRLTPDRIDPEIKKKIVAHAINARNVTATARSFGTTASSVRSYLKLAGIDTSDWQGYGEALRREAVEAAVQANSISLAAKKYDVSFQSICNWFDRYGIERPNGSRAS